MAVVIKFLKDLGRVKLILAGGIIIFLAILSGALIYSASSSNMAVLYSDLSVQDSNIVIKELESRNISYEVLANGSMIKVPENYVLKARLAIAESGAPINGSMVGYEIFDKEESLGTTSFLQNVKMLRALEGELGRTISSLSSVQNARVHLVIPQREMFSKEKQDPKASVVLKLSKAGVMSKSEVESIAHLVSTAVPGLQPSNVTIIDTKGHALKIGSQENEEYASDYEDYKVAYEKRLKNSLEELLGRSLGHDKVKVHVSAEINFDKLVTNSEIYDPDNTTIRSKQLVEEKERTPVNSDDSSLDISILNNLPSGSTSQNDNNFATTSRSDEMVNYEVSRTIQNKITHGGNVKKLSVAVLVDGKYVKQVKQEDGDLPQQTRAIYQPRSPEELKQLENLVKVAVGYDEERQDKIEVINMPFIQENVDMDEDDKMKLWEENLLPLIKLVIAAISILLVSLFVIKPLLMKFMEQKPSASAQAAGGGAGSQEGMVSNASALEAAQQAQKLQEVVDKHPSESLMVLRQWLNNE